LTSLFPDELGTDFFKTYNNYFEEEPCLVKTNDVSSDFSIDVFPNPSQLNIYVSYKSEFEGPIKCLMYNHLGQIVMVENLIKNSKELQFEKSVENLSNGIYLINFIEGKKMSIAKKIIIQD